MLEGDSAELVNDNAVPTWIGPYPEYKQYGEPVSTLNNIRKVSGEPDLTYTQRVLTCAVAADFSQSMVVAGSIYRVSDI